MLAMADLRDFFTRLRFDAPETLLQTGNVVFEGPAMSAGAIESALEAAAARRLKLETHFMVRTAAEFAALVKANPFPEMAQDDPGHLLVMFLKSKASAPRVKELQAGIKGREVVRAAGKQAYIMYPDGVGTSKLTNKVVEKALGTSSTGRNWNTVLKVAAAVAAR